jgi:hypothetical protein
VLKEAMARGELRPASPEFAANLLLSMLVGADRSHYLFSGDPPPEPNPEHVGQIIDCFLRAFVPEISSPNTVPQRSIP